MLLEAFSSEMGGWDFRVLDLAETMTDDLMVWRSLVGSIRMQNKRRKEGVI